MKPEPDPEPVATLVGHPFVVRGLVVQTVQRPTPRLVRVTLGGPQLEGFASLAPDDHVRVFFPTPGTTEPVLPEMGEHGAVCPTSGPRLPARNFTPGRFDPVALTLQLDIVLHAAGVAPAWAIQATPGQQLGMADHVPPSSSMPASTPTCSRRTKPACPHWPAGSENSQQTFQ